MFQALDKINIPMENFKWIQVFFASKLVQYSVLPSILLIISNLFN